MKPLRVGLAGYGYWGERLARNLAAMEDVDLLAIADPVQENLLSARIAHPSTTLVSALEDMENYGELDAVVLATPASTHGELGLRVLEAGKHLLVEKPLALDVLAAQRIVDAASDRNLTVMVGHTFLYSPAVRLLRKLVDEGSFGELKQMECRRLLGQVRTDCDVVWDLATHDVSILLYLLEEMPRTVSAWSSAHYAQDMRDSATAILTFPSGIDALITVGWVYPKKVRLITLVGSQQMVIYDDVPIDKKVTVFSAGFDDAAPPHLLSERASDIFSELDRKNSAGNAFIPALGTIEPLRAELEDFARACRDNEAPISSASFGLNVVKVLEAIAMSSATGGKQIKMK
jgi:predicted dehydrogenase